MIAGIKNMIARCMERMRGGACATCDNRTFCPAGRWQQAFAVPDDVPREGGGGIIALLGGLVQSMGQRQTRCLRQQVEAAIESLLESGEANVDRISRELGMSRQTLYRRLKAEDVTFEEVFNAKRRQLAMRYLRLDGISVKGAAYKLGFSDPAAFSRAFKRWTGFSPSQVRAA